jgi:hypothetical protein
MDQTYSAVSAVTGGYKCGSGTSQPPRSSPMRPALVLHLDNNQVKAC